VNAWGTLSRVNHRVILRTALPLLALLAAACAARPPADAGRGAQGGERAGAEGAATGRRYAAATESANATHAAMEALEKGASAADAAIVAALVAGVAVPVSSGIGGGGFAMVWEAKSRTATILDFRETAPAALDQAALDVVDRSGVAQGLKVGVPGEVAGLIELHRRWGTRPLAEDVEPAASMAETGLSLPPHMARALLTRWGQEARAIPVFGAAFFPSGNPARAGDIVKNPRLGATLRGIGQRGAAAFYEGPVAAAIVEAVAKAGGVMTEADLKAYKVVERRPLQARWGDLDVLTMPPPSAGGLLLLQTLGMFSKEELAGLTPTSAEGAHTLGEAFRGALADRVRYVGDPEQRPAVAAETSKLLDPGRLAARRAQIKPNETRAPAAFVKEEHGTSHIIVVDAAHNIVSLTTTVNGPFGSKVVAEGPGVLLNDELTDFIARPLAAKIGVADPAGAARPGARPPSSMMPTLVLRGGEPVLCLGGSGGYRIATGVPQVAFGALAQGLDVAAAIRRPRIHVTFDGAMLIERGALSPQALRDLEARGEKVREEENISAVQGVAFRAGDGGVLLEAAGDPRKFGLGQAR
jgi:gamma-glutamyltranspeptidase / glutathione hydrolase